MTLEIYLKIARNAIKSCFTTLSNDKEALVALYPELKTLQATFVTLTLHNRLRGCIGSIIAHRTLYDDIISNAKAAAFNDPRFPPLTEHELDDVVIEVSLLTHPEAIDYKDAKELSHIIRPKVDGVILRLGNHQATFLPQVWDELSDFATFFAHLGLKAGIGNDPLAYHPDIYVYQASNIKEE